MFGPDAERNAVSSLIEKFLEAVDLRGPKTGIRRRETARKRGGGIFPETGAGLICPYGQD